MLCLYLNLTLTTVMKKKLSGSFLGYLKKQNKKQLGPLTCTYPYFKIKAGVFATKQNHWIHLVALVILLLIAFGF